MQQKVKFTIAAITALVCVFVVSFLVGHHMKSQPLKPPIINVSKSEKPEVKPLPVIEPAKTPLKLTLSQQVGQRIIYSYNGFEPPKELKRLISQGVVGGIILFKRNIRNPSALSKTIEKLQSIPRPKGLEAPLLIMLDQEGGRVKRLPGPPRLAPQEIGKKGSTKLAGKEGTDTGRYLKEHGINVNLAPVVDVARPGGYEETSKRSYGRKAALVVKMTKAFSEGLLGAGVVPCFKHFPGLGAEPTDEDYKINRLDNTRQELTDVDEAPFYLATERCMVMTSTAIYPEIDPTNPALFSKKIVTGELRNRVKFEGLSITDDLDVPALRKFGSPTDRGRKSIKAGNDLLLYCGGLDGAENALQGLTALYKSKGLNVGALGQTVARIMSFRTAMEKNLQS